MADPPISSGTEPEHGSFELSFQRWAGRVRRRLLARGLLRGAAWGLVAGALASALAFWQRLGDLRPWALALGLAGALLGLLAARRGRWSDDDVALYLDAKLGTKECLVSARSLGRKKDLESDPALGFVIQSAGEALAKADPRAARPRVFERLHLVIPPAAAAIVTLSLLPLPPAPPPARPAPGSDRVRIANLRGLEKIEALERLRGKNPEQEARLKKLAEDARRLRAELAKGTQRRDALAQVSKLRDEIAAERQKLHSPANRAGLEAALAELERNRRLAAAARALGEGDVTAFDREMQKLANQAERDARDAAKEALEQAAKAAREKGAPGLADALEEQHKLFGEREAKGRALRELAEGLRGKLSAEALEELREFGESGSPEAQRKLAESLGKALEGLSDEERKRLAERLKKQLDGKGAEAMEPLSKRQIEELARRLGSDEGLRELEESLRELARSPESDEAERERALEEGERGGAQAQRELGGLPLPMAGEPGSPGSPQPGAQGTENPQGASGPGSKKDSGRGNHEGSTPEVSGNELRAKARAGLNPGLPMNAPSLGRAPGRAGETANQRGSGSLGSAREAEVGAVERSDIPEEYREHVGRYFDP